MLTINFNYNQAISQANQIDSIASDMINVANKQLQPMLDSIGACWRGEAAGQFVSYCTETRTDIRAQAKSLQNLAQRIREVARIIKEAEERAKELQRQQAAAAAATAASAAADALKK